MGFFWLVLAHFTGDWALQPHFLGVLKRASVFFLGVHAAIYTACIAFVLWRFLRRRFARWKVAAVFLSHLAVDYWKCYVAGAVPHNRIFIDALDQVIHFLVLLVVYIT